jgi:hypothetical protein
VTAHPDDLHLPPVGRYTLEDHPRDETAQEPLATLLGEPIIRPESGQRLAKVSQPLASLRRKLGLGGALGKARSGLRRLTQGDQRRFPLPLKLGSDQAVVGVERRIAAPRQLGLVACTGHLARAAIGQGAHARAGARLRTAASPSSWAGCRAGLFNAAR